MESVFPPVKAHWETFLSEILNPENNNSREITLRTFASLFTVQKSPVYLVYPPWHPLSVSGSLTRLCRLLSGEMVRQARILAQATSDLVNAIKADAEGESDLENSRKLLSAAKILADATAKMVEAAKVQSFLCRPLGWALKGSGTVQMVTLI